MKTAKKIEYMKHSHWSGWQSQRFLRYVSRHGEAMWVGEGQVRWGDCGLTPSLRVFTWAVEMSVHTSGGDRVLPLVTDAPARAQSLVSIP